MLVMMLGFIHCLPSETEKMSTEVGVIICTEKLLDFHTQAGRLEKNQESLKKLWSLLTGLH